ncbi:MAG: corrinoid protein [Bacillota bacterium]|nr:corrinoid protein [Bacillota bacterium]
MAEALSQLRQALLGADGTGALEETRRLLAEGMDPREILESGMAAAMAELGQRWNRGEAFLPEVVAAAEIFKKCSELVEPVLLARGEKKAGHRVVIGTVKGDLHDLGKNIVAAMMKTAGFDVYDLGKDVPAEKFVQAVRDLGASILGLSALLTTTMMEQKVVIEALQKAGLRSAVKVLVGGAPVTAQWATEIGADGYAPNAPGAVELALGLVGDRG